MSSEPFNAGAIDEVLGRTDYIGARMSTVEYRAALAKLGAGVQARIDLPKANATYAGTIIQWSDTHIVQKISPRRAIAHNVSKLANGMEMLQRAAKGDMTDISIVYDLNAGREAVRTLPAKAASDLVDASTQWAAMHIGSATSRAGFVERITRLERARQALHEPPAQTPRPSHPVLQPRMAER